MAGSVCRIRTVVVAVAVMAVLVLVASPAQAVLLYDNGPLVNSPGTGAGGADESVLQDTSLGMNTYGFGHQASAGYRVADDFTIPSGESWNISDILFYCYETGSGLSSTFTAMTLQIWDGVPGGGGSVIFGDTTTNRMTSSTFSNIYRVDESGIGGPTSRPIMANTVAVGTILGPGTYWLDWDAAGSASFLRPMGAADHDQRPDDHR